MTPIKYIAQALCLALVVALAACNAEPPKGTAKATVETPTKTAPATPDTAPKPADAKPADAKPADATPADAKPADAKPAAPAQAPKEYKLSTESAVGFVGYNMIGGREGGFSDFEGKVLVKDGNLETAEIDVTIKMGSVFSDSSILTPKLKGDKGFFEVDKFPTSTFKSTKVVKGEKDYTITGNLNLHGVEKTISFPATIAINGNDLTAKAEFSVNRHDWQIEYSATGDFAVKDDCLIRLDIKAVAAS